MADPNPPPAAASQAEDADEELLQAQAYIRCAAERSIQPTAVNFPQF